jgi:hypothetical protein
VFICLTSAVAGSSKDLWNKSSCSSKFKQKRPALAKAGLHKKLNPLCFFPQCFSHSEETQVARFFAAGYNSNIIPLQRYFSKKIYFLQ